MDLSFCSPVSDARGEFCNPTPTPADFLLFAGGHAIAVPADVPFVSSPIVQQVIGCAINVHREVGPGLFERVYQKCFASELSRSGLRFVEQVPLKLAYQNVVIPCAYRADAVVEDTVLVEIKAIDRLIPAHRAQVLTCLRLSGLRHGLLLNFNAPTLAEGLRSFVR